MRKVRAGLALVAVVTALFVTVASGESNEAKKVDSGADVTTTTGASGAADAVAATPSAFAVGDLVELGDWQVQVHEVTDPLVSSNQYLSPAAGQRWVAVDAEVFNQGDDVQTVSSMLCFEVQDATNRSHAMTITGESMQPPDGEVAPGASRRGTIVYEVPVDATGLRLQFKCDLLSTGSATINLS